MSKERPNRELWNTNLADVLSFQRNVLLRVSQLIRAAGGQASSGAFDPQAWINLHANFWGAIIADVGGWSRGSRRELGPDEARIYLKRQPIYSRDRTARVDIDVPSEAFDTESGELAEVTLVAEPLSRRVNGTDIPLPGNRTRFHPPRVKSTDPTGHFMLSDLRGLLNPGDVYRTFVWAEETRKPVAAIELEVQA
jgi:hypothetical protein